MGKTLGRYFLLSSARAFLIVACSLVMLYVIFDLISEFEDVGSAGYEAIDAFIVVAMLLPRRLVEQSAYFSMLGVFLTLASLSRTHELTAMLAAGISRNTIIGASLICVSLLFVLISAIEFAGRPLYQEAIEYRALQLSDRMHRIRDRGLWMIDENKIVNIGSLPDDGALTNVRIFSLGEGNKLDAFQFAKKATREENGDWILNQVIEKTYNADDGAKLNKARQQPWKPITDPAELLIKLPTDSLTLPQLYRQSIELSASGDDTTLLDQQFWSRVSLPLSGLAFSFLAAVISLLNIQRGELSRHMLIGTVTGLTLYIVSQMLTNAALVAGVTPALAVLLPVGVAVLTGTSILRWKSPV